MAIKSVSAWPECRGKITDMILWTKKVLVLAPYTVDIVGPFCPKRFCINHW